MYNKKSGGFSLIEVILAMAIIGILVTLSIIGISTAQKLSRDTERLNFLEQLNTSILDYYYTQKILPDLYIENNGTTLTLRREGRSFENTFQLKGTLQSKVGHVESSFSDEGGTIYCYVRASGGTYELSINMETAGWNRQMGTSSNPCTAGWPPDTL